MNYTYEINGSAVTPVGDWVFTYQRNEGQIFWRKVIDGEFIFKGDDYQTIMAMSECTEIDFEIFCKGESVWTGIFNFPYSFSIDEDSCKITGTPDVVDEYSCIMDNYDTEYYVEDFYDDLLPGLNYPICDITNCAGGVIGSVGVVRQGVALTYMFLNLFQNVGIITGKTWMNCSLSVVSSFFMEDDFPNGDVYATYYGTNNYVTGATNQLYAIIFIPNTIVRQDFGGTACAEQNDTISFKDLETWLRDRYNAYWYIDQNGDFRIEHISFFLPGFAHSDFGTAGIDLTALIAPQTGKSYAYRRNKYDYLTDQLYDQERWIWQHYWGTEGGVAHGLDFQGEPIYYGATVNSKYECVPGDFKEKELNTPSLWTDLMWGFTLANADDINCNGWLMLHTDWDYAAVNCQVQCDIGGLTGVNGQNRHLSTANLMLNYFTWDRIFIAGHMNNGATPPAVEITAFDSEIRKKLQIEIQFPICCEDNFDPIQGMTTEMGLGLLYSAELDQKSLTVRLLYD